MVHGVAGECYAGAGACAVSSRPKVVVRLELVCAPGMVRQSLSSGGRAALQRRVENGRGSGL
ncbi:hypothetical protein SBA1_820060 [Candidatus Sulfotelmatobacter kueseliae]|uniref:Uncharacterized protein n=1 Tax=Candidatus Sulfotelmatobacter kueseliae TaxID=2042962 RepID=A0A2U3L8Q6_9BACT|nr:hypothetical protein SBA1_820060 [Candidatus Sulfotelmatobacter kueseliae]